MTLRNVLIAAGSAVVLASLATGALAANIPGSAPASVTVLSPVTITKQANMAFGNVVRPTTGTTTITLNANDVVTAAGGDGSVVNTAPTTSAQFDVAGPVGTTYTTAQSLAFTQVGLNSVTVNAPVTSTGTLGTIPAGGIQTIRYGGSFTMNSGTTVQPYTGTLNVTVTYN